MRVVVKRRKNIEYFPVIKSLSGKHDRASDQVSQRKHAQNQR